MSRIRYLRKMIFDGRGAPAPPPTRPEPLLWKADAITGSCIGHSTVLINFFGVHVLTDPVFSRRVGPGVPPFILGPKRYIEPALHPKQMPAPDLLVLSHAHFDHFDIWSLRKFNRRTPVVTAHATGDLVRRLGFRTVHELRWQESTNVRTASGDVTVTAIEVAHWGARMMRDTHRGYNGYVLERRGHALCFAGDTAHTQAFRRLRELGRPLDLMLMPIGAYDPWIRAHCTPEQAVAMANDAGALNFVPLHHQTFKLSDEPMDEPGRRIRHALRDNPGRLLCVDVGCTFTVPLR
jgi:L-ascorbate metabolism protein UlaG (beta-lactamase superfamily)